MGVDLGATEANPVVAATSLDAVLAEELMALTRAGLRRAFRSVERRGGASILVDRRPAVDFASNDYLGLAADARLAHTAASALTPGALGAGGARLISGNHPFHEALERDLARFQRADAALLFGSGYLANVGTIPALVGKDDVIYADALNHPSLIDACRLSRAVVRVIPHRDVETLAETLTADRHRFRRRLIVVDGVFSMDGALAPLDRLVALARGHEAWTYVDDAHGTGVLGANGHGSAEHWGVEGEVEVVMGTLGKALGVSGAFVAGSRTLIEFLLNCARGFVFTTGTPPALAAAAGAALHIVRSEPERRARLRTVARRLREGLAYLGYEVPGEPDGHIIPIMLGDADLTIRIAAALRERGLLVGSVRPPTVPRGTSRLRIAASAAHTDSEVDRLLDALRIVLPHDVAA
jgi:8-amino-7-oxononanoate synthase